MKAIYLNQKQAKKSQSSKNVITIVSISVQVCVWGLSIFALLSAFFY